MVEIGLSGLMLDSPHSGTAIYTRNLAHWLPRVAPDLSFRLFLRRAVPEGEVVQERLVSPFARVGKIPGAGARLDKLAWETFSLPLASRSRRESILHSLYFAAPLIKPAPVVVTIHDLVPLLMPGYHRGLASRAYANLMAYAVRDAAAILTVSESAKRDIVSRLGIAVDRIVVTPEAADERFVPGSLPEDEGTVQKYRLPPRFLLYLGGAERRKNIEVLIRAWSRIRREMDDREVKLVVVARFPPPDTLYPDIPGLAKELGLEDSIRFVDSVAEEDKPSLYRRALAFCFPSIHEGFGLPPLEAMASGLPVICSSASSLPEVVGDGGYLVDPHDDAAWGEAAVRLVDSEAERTALGRRGVARAATFSWSRTAEQTANVYRDVLGR